jgi:hypothetical protein
MTPQKILKRVQEEADARMDEVIERLFFILRERHTHQCWRKACDCEYCQFINGPYINAKMILRRTKKNLRFYEMVYPSLTKDEISAMLRLESSEVRCQKLKIKILKNRKKELKENII